MTAQSVAALGARHDRRWWLSWLGRGASILLILAGLYLAKEYLGRDAASPGLQRVRLLNPAPPPPPPPREKPKEEPKPEEKVEVAEFEQPSDEPPPMDDRLGLDAEADGVGDGFGLAAKPGGRAITTIGGTGAGGRGGPVAPPSYELEKGYNRMLGWRLEAWLNRRAELRERTYRAVLDLWISPAGSVTRVRLVGPADDAALEDLLRVALVDMPPLTAPPAGYRQPVRVVVRSASKRTG